MSSSIKNIDFEPEINFKTARSSGKGGQHVNKVETKVLLEFDINASQLLSKKQKLKLFEKLGNRINNDNILQLSVEESRSQMNNKAIALERFYELLEKALKKHKKRKKTKPTKASQEKRIQKKKKQGEKKEMRKKIQ